MTASTPAEIEADVRNYQPWVRKKAHYYKGPFEYEDMYSEGMIAMWLARKKWDPAGGVKVGTWMIKSTLWRWKDILKSGQLVGQANHQGLTSHRAYLDHELSHDFSAENDPKAARVRYIEPAHHDLIDESVYHRSEIHDAIRSLTEKQRQYVLARFWMDFRKTERTQLLGTGSQIVWTRARAALRESLSHLSDMI